MIKSIREHLKKFNSIILFSHSDTDGAISALVIKKCTEGKKFSCKLNSYNNIDKNLQKLKLKPNELLVLTDIWPKDPSVLIPFIKTNQLLCIDHHETSAEFYNPEKMIFNIPSHGKIGMSAALLVYTLLECPKILCLKELVTICDDYDTWKKQDPRSDKFNILFQMYWERMIDAFYDGRTTFNQEELNFIQLQEYNFKQVYDTLELYDTEDNIDAKYPGYFFVTTEYINECCEKLFKDHPERKICFAYSPKSNTFSVRTSESLDINIGKLLSEVCPNGGGGHRNSGGIRLSVGDINNIEFITKTIKTVMDNINKEI
jgi:oligoribonuclease NrnB/cAMP/cGMP phosphodiesterase (DHH superfamily)